MFTKHAAPRLAILAAALAVPFAPAHAAKSIAGDWVTDDGRALVRIAPCGPALCGKIVKVLKPSPERPTTDVENPDPALRARPIEGLSILTGLVDAGSLWKGQIYDPQTGKTYAAKLTPGAIDTLKVEGCIAVVCKGPTWRRASR